MLSCHGLSVVGFVFVYRLPMSILRQTLETLVNTGRFGSQVAWVLLPVRTRCGSLLAWVLS